MALSLSKSFKRRVPRKPAEKCHWKTHFTGCAREVIGALEYLAKNRTDRFIYAEVPAIVKMCNGKYRPNGSRRYSQPMVEKCLQTFRELQILSRKLTVTIDDVPRKGRILNTHDAMTQRYPRACVFIGGSKKPGVWGADGVWQPNPERSLVGGLVVDEITGDSRGDIVGNIMGDTPKNDGVVYAADDGPGCFELLDSTSDTRVAAGDSLVDLAGGFVPYPSELVKPGEPVEPFETENRIVSEVEGTRHQTKTNATSTPLDSLTHLQNRTVGQHFEGKSGGELIYWCTDGELTVPDFNGTRTTSKAISDYESLAYGLASTVNSYKDVTLTDRRVLAKIMNGAIGGGRAPRPFFKVMKDFQELGGPILLKTPEPEVPRNKWDIRNFMSFRDAWQKLAGDSDVPRGVLEDYYERDAVPDKPRAPWRSDGD